MVAAIPACAAGDGEDGRGKYPRGICKSIKGKGLLDGQFVMNRKEWGYLLWVCSLIAVGEQAEGDGGKGSKEGRGSKGSVGDIVGRARAG